MPCGQDGKQEYADIRILNSKTKKETEYKKGEGLLKVSVEGEARIQSLQCLYELDNSDHYNKIEKMVNKAVEAEVKEAVAFVQKKYKTDIFGFGDQLYQTNPETFSKIKKEWQDIFSNSKVEVVSSYKLRRSGIKNDSFKRDLPDGRQNNSPVIKDNAEL
ncbi:Ger(x)C family spore germination C-terminal domain-containing protein [Metabacillus sp. 84]|uniref:Ger(x)C family spore germination C-terminal domain-containing protein n=1 Tax=unclassified Metabacillus TaxID=2675274 RepID=UPI003CE6B423